MKLFRKDPDRFDHEREKRPFRPSEDHDDRRMRMRRPERPKFAMFPEDAAPPELNRFPDGPEGPDFDRFPDRPEGPDFDRFPDGPEGPDFDRFPDRPEGPDFDRFPDGPEGPDFDRFPDRPERPDFDAPPGPRRRPAGGPPPFMEDDGSLSYLLVRCARKVMHPGIRQDAPPPQQPMDDMRPGGRPEDRMDERAERRPDSRRGGRPDERPDGRPGPGRPGPGRPGGRQPRDSQERVLRILSWRESISQQELRDHLHIRPGSLSELLGKLEAQGLIEKEQDPQDRRKIMLRLSQAGWEAIEAEGNKRPEREDIFAVLDESEQETLRKLLEKLL